MAEYDELRQLLSRHITPGADGPGFFRFHDAPPSVVHDALALAHPHCRTDRPNGQPPAEWLIEMAARFGGALSGLIATDDGVRHRMRVDAICVPGDHGTEVARCVARDWPEPEFGETVLALALAEGWTSWDATEPVWTGSGPDLMWAETPPPVIGLWWD